MTTYTVHAHRWARGWELHIDGVGVTQSHTLNDAEAMVRDYIALDKGVAPESFNVEIIPQLDSGLDTEAAAARQAVAAAEKAQRTAAAQSRVVASNLKGVGLTGREIALYLGISPQRVSQLLKTKDSGLGSGSPRWATAPTGEAYTAGRHIKIALDSAQEHLAAPPGDPDKHPWVTQALGHELWRAVEGQPGAAALRATVARVVAELSEQRDQALRSLAGDPWRDTGIAVRTAERLRLLIQELGIAGGLSPAEIALLIVMPFLRDSVQTVHASRSVPAVPAASWLNGTAFPKPGSTQGPVLAELGQFAGNYPRLQRRTERLAVQGHEQAAAAIAWWIFRRQDRRNLRLRQVETTGLVAEMVKPTLSGEPESLVHDALTPARLAALEETMDGDPVLLAYTDRPAALRPRVIVRAAALGEQRIREQFLGYLLMLAAMLAIDPGELGEVIVDHVGTTDGVNLAEMMTTVTTADWAKQDPGLMLYAQCAHDAVEVALRAHVTAVNEVLQAARRAAEESTSATLLAGLPAMASAGGVMATGTAAGVPAYSGLGTRFQLDADRIQELLMGTRLYQDQGLAIRELYQNALDACRYRQARTAFLERTEHPMPSWSGKITFDQSTDESGRPYLECSDNGIGMGLRELREAFSQAGTRFTHLPEFIQEQADWKALDPPLELFPNSRFGIGVLSYFMLADEIEVTSTRMDRSGRLGDQLRMIISGPGALFRIQSLGPGHDAGTTVRLYLHDSPATDRTGRPPLSCVDLLRRLLWVAEFNTSARHGTEEQQWLAGALSDAAPIGTKDALSPEAVRSVSSVHGRTGDNVWWCDGTGAILADGIWAGETLADAVVNLVGPHAPTLSVDRRMMLNYDHSAVKQLMLAAAPNSS